MGTKTNPNGFRYGVVKPYSSCWFANSSLKYSQFLGLDNELRLILCRLFPNLVNVIIHRKQISKWRSRNIPKKIGFKLQNQKSNKIFIILVPRLNNESKVEALSPYSRTILNFKGVGSKTKRLSKPAKARLLKLLPDAKIIFQSERKLTAQIISIYIQDIILEAQRQSNLRFKTVLRRLIKLIPRNYKGFQIKVSGLRSNSVIARSETILQGRVPKQRILANIDYVAFSIPRKLGLVGIKIWLYL